MERYCRGHQDVRKNILDKLAFDRKRWRGDCGSSDPTNTVKLKKDEEEDILTISVLSINESFSS